MGGRHGEVSTNGFFSVRLVIFVLVLLSHSIRLVPISGKSQRREDSQQKDKVTAGDLMCLTHAVKATATGSIRTVDKLSTHLLWSSGKRQEAEADTDKIVLREKGL